MTNIYISIVGTQIAAVFNPIYVLEQEGTVIDKIVLMATEESRKYADRIKEIIEGAKQNKKIIIEPISSTNEIKGNKKPAHIVLQKYLNSNLVIFNLAGGMNFQIVNCAIHIYKSQIPIIYYIYPEDRKCYLTKFTSNKFEIAVSEQIPAMLSVSDILKFHGVQYSIIHNNGNQTQSILDALKADSPQILEHSLKNVKIGNVFYDFIFNNGFNSLTFIASVNSNKALESARDIITAASGRDIIPNIFHRKFIVLTDNKYQNERLDGVSKIATIIDTNNCGDFFKMIFEPAILKSNSSNIAEYDQKSFETFEVEETYTINYGEKPKVLYVVLGPDILPTLIALWSSRADEVVFIYTPNNKTIEKYKTAIRENKLLLNKEINIKKISFSPASIIGNEILNIKIDKDKQFISVISPGTKSQGYFVALLGLQAKNNVNIYSISDEHKKLFCLYSSDKEEHLDLNGPDPSIILQLKGEKFQQPNGNGKTITDKDEKNKLLFSFIQKLFEKKYSINNLFFESSVNRQPNRQPVPIECFEYTEIRKGIVRLIKKSDALNKRRDFSYSLDNGEWFEELIGYVMAKCGADNVRTRVRMEWLPETQTQLERTIHHGPIHKNDIDVVARFKNIYYVISCKATNIKEDVAQHAREVQYYAQIFGRFCIPMVCYLKFEDEPKKESDVFVFGYKTFSNIQKMQVLLKKAALDKKTKK